MSKVTSTHHAWRGDDSLTRSREAREEQGADSKPLRSFAPSREYSDIPGFCKSTTTAEIAAHGHVITPGRYVSVEEVEDDGAPFEEKMPSLVAEQRAQSAKLGKAIKANLRGLGLWRVISAPTVLHISAEPPRGSREDRPDAGGVAARGVGVSCLESTLSPQRPRLSCW